MSRRSKSPYTRPFSSRKVEGDLKRAFDLIADAFDDATNDLSIDFRIAQTRDWETNDVNDIKVEFVVNRCNSTGFLEDYFKRKLRDPNCIISFENDREKPCLIMVTNYTRILSFYSLRHWIAHFCKKNTAWIILVGLLIWYICVTFYGYYYQTPEIESQREEK